MITYISNPFKTWWKSRKTFKRPKLKFYIGKPNGHFSGWGSIFRGWISDIQWKDCNSEFPYVELGPSLRFVFFDKIQISIEFIDPWEYFEQMLFYLYYCDQDLQKSKLEWPWVEYKTNKSTWNDKFLVNYVDN